MATTTDRRKTAARSSVRLKDVAAAAGVSVMTASRALRGEAGAAETRQRVLQAAERLGYQQRVRQGRPRRATVRARPCVDVVVGTAVAPHGLYYSALLVGQEGHYFSRDMLRGYTEGLQLAGLVLDERLIWRGDFTADGARACVLDALKDGVAFDAVFTNDEMAAGVLRALHEAGRRVPDEVAVMGCDGLPMGACTIPSLTTLDIDTSAMATMAVERVLAPRRADPSPCHMRLCARIEQRESA